MIVKIAHNAVVAKLMDASDEIQEIVADLLSYNVAGAEHSFAFQTGTWSGKSTFFEFKTCTFPAGFVYMIHHELMRRKHQVQLIRKPHFAPLGPESPIVDEFGNDDPRYDFQMKSLKAVERHGRGIIQVATGGGKSKIAKLIMMRYRRPTLFLTTRGVLMYQMADQLEELKINTGMIGDMHEKMVRGINLGMVQTFVAALKEPTMTEEREALIKSRQRSKKNAGMTDEELDKKARERFDEKTKRRNRYLKFLETIEVVIGEEAHEAGGNSYYEILRHCKNASIRVALTATPFMRDSAEDNMRLMAAFGSVLIKITEKELIDRGILARPIFKFVRSEKHPKLFKTSPWQRAFQLGYTENNAMHKDIIRDALMAKRYNLPFLTLITRMDHGEVLYKKMRHVGLNVVFLKGEDDQKARKEALGQLARGEIEGIIGSTIVDVGVDVPALVLVQLAGGGKAEVALRQRIGRGLRAKKGMPNVTFIADYTCAGNLSLDEHTRSRRKVIESTPGFAENILPANDDFDWSIFAAQRKAAA